MDILKSFVMTIDDLQSTGLLRLVKIRKKYKTDYSSNDYLGLAKSIKARIVLILYVLRYGFGGCSSKYISGYSKAHQKLDDTIANYYKKESASVFGSGYMASVGILQGICNKETIIIADRFIHASWIDGAFVSNTRITRYNHNNLPHLELLLNKYRDKYRRIVILTETVFSMHGTVIDISQYLSIAKKNNAILITDHAHSLGILPFEAPDYDLHIIMGTFSKACAGFGGYVCGKSEIMQTISNLGRTQIYSTSLPDYLAAYNQWAFNYAIENTGAMLDNARIISKKYGLNFKGSAILTKEFETLDDAYKFQKTLIAKSIYAPVIRKPTVPYPIIRFCATI